LPLPAEPLLPPDEWLLAAGHVFLNHGSFGATPRAVLAIQDAWRQRMEARPTGFMTYELPGALRAAAARLAACVGAAAEDLAFIDNATAGCNAVLNALIFAPGDEILITDHTYPAVRKAAAHVAARAGARVITAAVPFPLAGAREIVAAVAAALSPRTRLAVLDHVTSPTAVIFPVHELVALCRSVGARVLIDGAHAPGMLALDIPAMSADWYVGNCHKWLMAPKGSGFIWSAPARQAEIHPLAISHGYGDGFLAEFDWTGTRDPSAWLAVPAAIDFHQRLGGEQLRARNAALAREAADLLAARWETGRGTPDALTGSMATVRLPLDLSATPEHAVALRATLYHEHRIETAISCFADHLWVRVSAQAYNRPADYQILADAILALTRDQRGNGSGTSAGTSAR
jgi:isopenicillin-N epimerase